MKALLIKLFEKLLPHVLLTYRAVNNRKIFKKKYKQSQIRVRDRFFDKSEIRISGGPFKGLRYIDETVWGSITPKWFGSYEEELHEVIEAVIKEKYEVIIDVGCAEGYYAAGLAYRLPASKIFAFDTDFISRNQLIKLAKINKISKQIKIGKFCSFKDINNLAVNKTMLVSDIEGYERFLLDPDQCSALKNIDILVEIHDFKDYTDTDQLLSERFNKTHDITEITATDRNKWMQKFINSNVVQDNEFDLLENAIDESRGNGLKWYWMKVKSTATSDFLMSILK